MPTACASSSTSTIPRPSASASCRTTCRSTPPAPSTKPSRPPKPGASCAAWSSTTPQSTPVGSTWSRSRSACSRGSVSAVESTIPNDFKTRSPHGSGSETRRAPASNGCSQPTKLAPKSAAPIRIRPKSQNHCDELLGDLSLWHTTALVLSEGGEHWDQFPKALAARMGLDSLKKWSGRHSGNYRPKFERELPNCVNAYPVHIRVVSAQGGTIKDFF